MSRDHAEKLDPRRRKLSRVAAAGHEELHFAVLTFHRLDREAQTFALPAGAGEKDGDRRPLFKPSASRVFARLSSSRRNRFERHAVANDVDLSRRISITAHDFLLHHSRIGDDPPRAAVREERFLEGERGGMLCD